jgi:phosphohistidine phosphatase
MMLLIVRHGVAEDKEEFAKGGKPDDERPLTAKGRKKMKRAAGGLRVVAPEIEVLATSPLVRAKQTAEIVASAYDRKVDTVASVLRPDSPVEAFIDWLEPPSEDAVVCVVGHEPHLSGLATWLMCGGTKSRLELAKGGACLLSFDGAPKKSGATLMWLLTSKQLEAICESS